MLKFISDYSNENREYRENVKRLNKEAEGLNGLKRLLIYCQDVRHAGVYSTITDIVDALASHEERLKKLEK